ncbi:MAG: PTS sugar transporter subunit IIA [Pseudomonadota bacterium]
MSDLSNLLDKHSIVDRLDAERRIDVLTALAERLSVRSGLRQQDIASALETRAQDYPVGVGDGVAIPHARLSGVKRPTGAFGRLASPIDFDAHDERPCDLIFVLLTPADNDSAHLKALAQIARAFRDADLRAALRRHGQNIAQVLIGPPQGAAA